MPGLLAGFSFTSAGVATILAAGATDAITLVIAAVNAIAAILTGYAAITTRSERMGKAKRRRHRRPRRTPEPEPVRGD